MRGGGCVSGGVGGGALAARPGEMAIHRCVLTLGIRK